MIGLWHAKSDVVLKKVVRDWDEQGVQFRKGDLLEATPRVYETGVSGRFCFSLYDQIDFWLCVLVRQRVRVQRVEASEKRVRVRKNQGDLVQRHRLPTRISAMPASENARYSRTFVFLWVFVLTPPKPPASITTTSQPYTPSLDMRQEDQ